jgi:MFS family permease
MWLIVPFLSSYVLAVGGNAAEAGMVIAVFSLTALLSRPLVGRLVDRFGRKRIALIGCLIGRTHYGSRLVERLLNTTCGRLCAEVQSA